MFTTFPPFYCGSSAILECHIGRVFGLYPQPARPAATENRLFSTRGGVSKSSFFAQIFGFLPSMLSSCRYHVDFMLAFARQNKQVTPNFFTLRFMALADPSPVNIFLKHSTHVGHFVGHFRI